MSVSREEQIAANLKERAEIQADLLCKGIFVEYFPYDLYKSKDLWLSCVPTIKEWNFKVKSNDVFETLIRLLAIPPLKKTSTAKEIIGEFYRTGLSDGTKWAIGNTMEVIANDEVLDDIIAIIDDKSNGKAREMFAVALGNMKDPKVVPCLVNLLDDEDMTGHAIMGLSKLKAVSTIDDIRKAENHPRTWVRKEAQKTVRKFEKIIEKQKQVK
jgi:hypothetical protein